MMSEEIVGKLFIVIPSFVIEPEEGIKGAL